MPLQSNFDWHTGAIGNVYFREEPFFGDSHQGNPKVLCA